MTQELLLDAYIGQQAVDKQKQGLLQEPSYQFVYHSEAAKGATSVDRMASLIINYHLENWEGG